MDGSGPPPPPASVRCGRGCGRDRLAAFMAWLLGRQARSTARVRWSGRAGAVRGGYVRAAVAGPTARRSERSGWKRRRGVPGRLLRSQRPDRGGILSRVGPGRARHRAGRAGRFCRRHRLLRPLSPAGLPLGLAFWLLPGPPSLLGVSIAHIAATCGFLGPGPYLLKKLHLL